jgi:hypothetical protein
MCAVLLPSGVNPIAIKYIISYHIISYHIISYIIYHISYIISYHISYHIVLYIISYRTSYHIISYILYHIYHIIHIIITKTTSTYNLHPLNRASWYTYVRKTNKMHTFINNLFHQNYRVSNWTPHKDAWWNTVSCLYRTPPDDEQLLVRNMSRIT